MPEYEFAVTSFTDTEVQFTYGPHLLLVGLQGAGFALGEDGRLTAGLIEATSFAFPVTVDGTPQLVSLQDWAPSGSLDLQNPPHYYSSFSTMEIATSFAYGTFFHAFQAAWATNDPGDLPLVGQDAAELRLSNVAEMFVVAAGPRVLARDGDDRILVIGEAGGQVFGNAGDDTLAGDAGDDTLAGNRGDDSLDGRGGNDYLFGGPGADLVMGGAGDDFVYGGANNDSLEGGAGADRILGHGGRDWLHGGEGDDTLAGLSGNDILRGEGGNDVLFGGAGGDVLVAYAGRDVLVGGAGPDAFVLLLPGVAPTGGHAQELTGTAVIVDFDPQEDVLWIGPHANGSYTAQEALDLFLADATQVGGDVIFDDGLSRVVLRDVDIDDLTIAQFTHGVGIDSWIDPV